MFGISRKLKSQTCETAIMAIFLTKYILNRYSCMLYGISFGLNCDTLSVSEVMMQTGQLRHFVGPF